VWAQANPALGIRITTEHVAMEQRSMDPRTFAVERLGVGDWPRVTGEDGAIISIKQWLSLVDPQSGIDDRPVFAFDVSPDRSSAAVGVAGFRDDGWRTLRSWSTSAGRVGSSIISPSGSRSIIRAPWYVRSAARRRRW
jgi:hypothetical protein